MTPQEEIAFTIARIALYPAAGITLEAVAYGYRRLAELQEQRADAAEARLAEVLSRLSQSRVVTANNNGESICLFCSNYTGTQHSEECPHAPLDNSDNALLLARWEAEREVMPVLIKAAELRSAQLREDAENMAGCNVLPHVPYDGYLDGAIKVLTDEITEIDAALAQLRALSPSPEGEAGKA